MNYAGMNYKGLNYQNNYQRIAFGLLIVFALTVGGGLIACGNSGPMSPRYGERYHNAVSQQCASDPDPSAPVRAENALIAHDNSSATFSKKKGGGSSNNQASLVKSLLNNN